MATLRQHISDLRSMNRIISSDALLTDRALASELFTAALVLIKQQTDKRKLFQSPNLFTNIPCLEMEEAPLADCCEIVTDRKVARSVKTIPKIAEGTFGLLIQQVMGIDRTIRFNETTAVRYANLMKLKLNTGQALADKQHYFWILHNRVWVTNQDTRRINFAAFFEEEIPGSLLCPTDDCDCHPSTSDCDPCTNPLDMEFKCPGFLLDAVKKMVQDKLLKTYFNVPGDKQTDNIDGQSR